MFFLFAYEVSKHTFVVLLVGYKQERGRSEASHSKPCVAPHVPADLSSAGIRGGSQPRQRIRSTEHSTASEHLRTLTALLTHSAIEKSACEMGKMPSSETAFISQQ